MSRNYFTESQHALIELTWHDAKFRDLPHAVRKRLRLLLLLAAGHGIDETSRTLKCARATVYNTLNAFREGRIPDLLATLHGGARHSSKTRRPRRVLAKLKKAGKLQLAFATIVRERQDQAAKLR